MSLINVVDVKKQYATNLVLNGLSISIDEHQIACLIGGSGSGKSTLLRCINGLEEIDSGEIWFDGEVISGLGVDFDLVRRNIGMVFQSYNLFPHLTVLENVGFATRHVLHVSKAEANQRAMALLARVGLDKKADCYPDRLSGGQQQRVAIARALAMEPKMLLLDEITSALDPELVGEVLNLMTDLARAGMTMVIATHEMAFAREVSSRIYFLDGGNVHEEGPPDEIFRNPQRERTKAFLQRNRSASAP